MTRFAVVGLLLFAQFSWSQCEIEPTGNLKVAKNYLAFAQFTCALDEFLIAYQEKPTSPKINKGIAACYAGIPGKTPKAIPYLEFLLKKYKYDEEDLWILANAYHQNHDFDKGVMIAERMIKEFKPDEEILKNIDRLISNCKAGEELKKFPIKIEFENLGEEVNSEWDEINPIVSEDESEILFTTTRKGTMGGYPYMNGFVSDIFVAKAKRGKYKRPRSIGGSFNSIDIDEVAGTSPDARALFISTDAEGYQVFNLRLSEKGERSRSFPRPLNLDGINSNSTNEHSATMNNKGDVIIFSSDREGGFGGYDLWIVRKLPTGEWSQAQNLGSTINTEGNEINPRLKENEKDLLFCSEGHFNMGGFDIFESSSQNNFQEWSEPKNLGYPINTPLDDHSIFYMHKGRVAYKAAYRSDSYGQADLYRLTFLDSTPRFTIVRLKLHTHAEDSAQVAVLSLKKDSIELSLDSLLQVTEFSDTLAHQQAIDSVKQVVNELEVYIASFYPDCFAEVEVTNSKTEQLYGNYKSNPIKGGVLMLLEPGQYDISITAEGYLPINTSLSIDDMSLFVPLKKEDHRMKRR